MVRPEIDSRRLNGKGRDSRMARMSDAVHRMRAKKPALNSAYSLCGGIRRAVQPTENGLRARQWVCLVGAVAEIASIRPPDTSECLGQNVTF